VLEGDWHPRFLGMVRFPTYDQARAWYDSPEYAPLKAMRLAHARIDIILADALADDQPYESSPQLTDTARARLDAFLAEAARRGVPPDRFHPGETVEAVLAGLAAKAASPPTPPERAALPAAEALERVEALLPALDREGRERVLARCRELDGQGSV
jgi:hypothetical protein